jgi:hypothetical protein
MIGLKDALRHKSSSLTHPKQEQKHTVGMSPTSRLGLQSKPRCAHASPFTINTEMSVTLACLRFLVEKTKKGEQPCHGLMALLTCR